MDSACPNRYGAQDSTLLVLFVVLLYLQDNKEHAWKQSTTILFLINSNSIYVQGSLTPDGFLS